MKKFLLRCSILLSLLIPVNIFSQGFKVSGTKLLDANNEVFIIRGVNVPCIWYFDQSYQSLSTLSDMGVNTIRIVWKTNGSAGRLDSLIQRCIELKMVPMVELHNVTGSPSADKLLETVSYYVDPEIIVIINRYQKYLLINLANEWGNHMVTSADWENAYDRAIDTLRNAGIKTTLVIDAPGWGQNITPILEKGQMVLDHDPLKNILFSVHMYGSWNNATDIQNKLQQAYNDSLPLIVGEFGYNYNNGENNLHCKVNHATILSTCRKLGYGYMPWSWTGNNEINAWLDMAEFSDWKTLTWWGKEVMEGPNGIIKTAKKASVF